MQSNEHISEPALYTAPWLRARATDALHGTPTEAIFDARTGRSYEPGDFDLNPELMADLGVMDPPRPAAVLVPIVDRDPLTVLLTVRTEHLASHAGQIAFPGGKMDMEDVSPLHTALREADEEIGLASHHVDTLGYLDSYRTGTGFRIMPVVALVSPDFELSLNAGEVADAFEVPLPFLMDPLNHQRHSREWRGRLRHYYAMPYGERYIWGATAAIIKNLHGRLFRS